MSSLYKRIKMFPQKGWVKLLLFIGLCATFLVILGYGLFFLHTGNAWLLLKEGKFTASNFYFARGNYYFGGGAYDIEKALTHFKHSLQYENKENNPIHYQIGRISFIKGDLYGAIQEFDSELRDHPEYKRTHYMRGLTYGYLNQFEKAAEDFKKFLEWKPNSWAGHNDIVWVFFRQGDFENAEKYAREGLLYVPDNPWLANSLGAILLNGEKYNEAEEYLRKAHTGFSEMSNEEWGRAYPGNDPRIYGEGKEASLRSVEANLALVRLKLSGE